MPEIVDKVLGRAFSVESRMMLTAHIEGKDRAGGQQRVLCAQ